MNDYPSAETRSAGPFENFSGPFRLTGHIVGLGLLVLGCYYGLGILTSILGFLSQPDNLGKKAELMAISLSLDGVKIPLGGEDSFPVGKAAGAICLFCWYFLAGFLCWSLIGLGGKMLMASFTERREFYAAVREMMQAIRRQQDQISGSR